MKTKSRYKKLIVFLINYQVLIVIHIILSYCIWQKSKVRVFIQRKISTQ